MQPMQNTGEAELGEYSIREKGENLQHVESRVRETVRTCDLKEDEKSDSS